MPVRMKALRTALGKKELIVLKELGEGDGADNDIPIKSSSKLGKASFEMTKKSDFDPLMHASVFNCNYSID